MNKSRKIIGRYVWPSVAIAFLAGLAINRYHATSENYKKIIARRATAEAQAHELRSPVETLEASVEKVHIPGDGRSPLVADRDGYFVAIDLGVKLEKNYIILSANGLEYRVIDNGIGHSLGKKAKIQLQKTYYDVNNNHVIDPEDRLVEKSIEVDGKFILCVGDSNGGLYLFAKDKMIK